MTSNLNTFESIKNAIIKALTARKNLTNKQAHNVSAYVLFLHLVEEDLKSKFLPDIQQFIIDICYHIQTGDVMDKSIPATIDYTMADLMGDPKIVEKVHKYFNKIIKQLHRIDTTLQIMNLTSIILRKEEEPDLFKQTIAKFI